jgi:hypothetical protein
VQLTTASQIAAPAVHRMSEAVTLAPGDLALIEVKP